MRKKLLVLFGAGSSVEQGIPSVAEIDALMKEWSANSTDYVCTGLDAHYLTKTSNYFELLRESIVKRNGYSPNFEKVLGDMLGLANWMDPPPAGTSLRQITCNGKPPIGVEFECSGPASYEFDSSEGTGGDIGPAVAIFSQFKDLLSCLAREIRRKSLAIDSRSDSFRRYSNFVTALRERFDVGVYSLNYDSALLMAWPDPFTGFDINSGAFHAVGVHQRTQWGFAYHLHGNVHHTLSGPRGTLGTPISWQEDLRAPFDDGNTVRPLDGRTDGRHFPITTLIVGEFKLDQMLVEPFASLNASLFRHIYEADAILIGGYGFGDIHVNRALQNRLEHRKSSARPPILVVTSSRQNDPPIQLRTDRWSWNLKIALDINEDVDNTPVHEETIAAITNGSQFEKLNKVGIAIWHGGFTSCVDRLGDVLDWLGGRSH